MPVFTPGRRWQPPFYPFKREPPGRHLLAMVERAVKGPLFGCRMCGNCLLQETAFICPMACPKGLRNGPCSSSVAERCCVDPTRPCIWYRIYKRAAWMRREEMLLEVMPPLDWDKVGTETWGDVAQQIRSVGVRNLFGGMFSRNPARRAQVWDSVFRPIRQPDWWTGDAEYHSPAYNEPTSELERRLRAGEFVVTTEVQPPLSSVTDRLSEKIEMVKPYVSAINFTDNASARPRMSSQACSLVALNWDTEPVMQIAARDRTRMGLQAEVIGASALGVRNILCLSGDHSRMGMPPLGRSDIVDIDAVQMLWLLRRMRDEGKYLDGRTLEHPPRFLLGAAGAPFATEPRIQAIREEKKINAGAQFFQTNLVYDPDGLDVWLNELARRNVLGKVHILIGLTPLKSLRMARYIHDHLPAVTIPRHILKRVEAAGDGAAEEGVTIALELIEAIKSKEGVSGVHLMPVGWESIVPRIVTEAGLLAPDPVSPLSSSLQMDKRPERENRASRIG
jgi:methylenetetrahydrofolate reductase (NADPH)